jgi:hypothetical protein
MDGWIMDSTLGGLGTKDQVDRENMDTDNISIHPSIINIQHINQTIIINKETIYYRISASITPKFRNFFMPPHRQKLAFTSHKRFILTSSLLIML